jgi:hypothetical protein
MAAAIFFLGRGSRAPPASNSPRGAGAQGHADHLPPVRPVEAAVAARAWHRPGACCLVPRRAGGGVRVGAELALARAVVVRHDHAVRRPRRGRALHRPVAPERAPTPAAARPGVRVDSRRRAGGAVRDEDVVPRGDSGSRPTPTCPGATGRHDGLWLSRVGCYVQLSDTLPETEAERLEDRDPSNKPWYSGWAGIFGENHGQLRICAQVLRVT